MRFLVTRPQPECRLTADRLRSEGHVADELPLLVATSELPGTLDLEGVGAIAFTSRRAVDLLATHRQVDSLVTLPVFAVGKATAEACARAGFESVLTASDGVGSLAKLILDNRSLVAGKTVLYPAARQRAGDLEGLLSAGNILCRTVVVYRMDPLTRLPGDMVRNLDDNIYDGILIFSRRTAEALVSLIETSGLDHIFSDLSVYAISRQAAEPLSRFNRVHVADAPCQNALLELALAEC
ncbi:MAG: uroporphyrinogen-III synthase [Roseibium sp.]|nr:uroporphyrinogen-III synthase [Roseibium sp.]